MPDASDNPPSRCIAVIGGGISGLAAAHRLVERSREAGSDALPTKIILLEASDRLGGVFGTERHGDYLIETGADSFITDKPWGVDLCRRLNLEDQLIPSDATYRRSLILSGGKPVPTPSGFNLIGPAQIKPILTTPLLSARGKARLMGEVFVPRRPADAPEESLAEFVRRRFGQEALDRIVQPLVAGIYTADPEKLSLQATLPRFIDLEQEYGSVTRGLLAKASARRRQSEMNASGARYGLFVSLAGGMQALIDALTREIEAAGVEIRRQTPVASITRADATAEYHIELTSGETLSASGIVLAVPAYVAGRLCEQLHPELSRRLQEVEYASAAIVVTAHRLSDITHPCDAFGLVIPRIENRKVLAVSFLSRKFPGRAPAGSIILRTFVGGATQPEQLDVDDDTLLQKVRDELKGMLGVGGTPELVRIARWDRAMPQYHVGHLSRIATIRELASSLKGLSLAGNAYAGVGLPDCIHSGENAADAIWESDFPTAKKGPAVA